MSLREIARREPGQPTVDADKCPSCQWFDAMEREASKSPEGVDRSKLANARGLRLRHEASGECLNPDGAG
ncbi:hypothetical protein [Kitasatospora sp. NPDC056731]|uniref:hypothetical protein n=1 Tax=Kitasatospora sp. NPDC056731 TaxID=3155422 RepID=UPI00341A992B